MPYAIYRLSGHNPASLGFAEFGAMALDNRSVVDARFVTFGKDEIAVQQDLFNFIAQQQREEEESRVPDDLELMYAHETQPYPGMPYDPTAGGSIHDIQMDHRHRKLCDAWEGLRLETVLFYGAEDEAVIDEAREIVRDREVTLALARVSNPHALVMNLTRIIADIDRDSRRCVSFAAASSHEDYIEMLKATIESYTKLHESLRFVTLASEKKEA
ncbi:hypothetical protein D3C87_860090 [compost metagenome]